MTEKARTLATTELVFLFKFAASFTITRQKMASNKLTINELFACFADLNDERKSGFPSFPAAGI